MPRLMLSDEFWPKLEEILLQEAIDNKRNLRMTVEDMLYQMGIGCPGRDLSEAFGSWSYIYKRLPAWSLSSKWLRIFRTLPIVIQTVNGNLLMAVMLKRTSIVQA